MKEIPGYPGYFALENGTILSAKRDGVLKKLTPRVYCGYLRVNLYIEGSPRRAMTVHRAVALAYHGEPQFAKACVNHKDGNKLNNHKDNLEWVTYKQNRDHAKYVLGHHKSVDNRTTKLTPQDVVAIRLRRSQGERECDLAREYGVKPCAISHIVARRSWASIP